LEAQRKEQRQGESWLLLKAVKLFVSLTNEEGHQSIIQMIDWQRMQRQVFLYDHASRTAHACGEAVASPIAWPIIWLLAAHSRKHIFQGRRRPSMQSIGVSIAEFIHKLRWRFVYSSSAQRQSQSQRERERERQDCRLETGSQRRPSRSAPWHFASGARMVVVEPERPAVPKVQNRHRPCANEPAQQHEQTRAAWHQAA